MLQFQLVYFHLSETMWILGGRFKLVTYYMDLVDICFILFSYACPRVSGSGSCDGYLTDAPPPLRNS